MKPLGIIARIASDCTPNVTNNKLIGSFVNIRFMINKYEGHASIYPPFLSKRVGPQMALSPFIARHIPLIPGHVASMAWGPKSNTIILF